MFCNCCSVRQLNALFLHRSLQLNITLQLKNIFSISGASLKTDDCFETCPCLKCLIEMDKYFSISSLWLAFYLLWFLKYVAEPICTNPLLFPSRHYIISNNLSYICQKNAFKKKEVITVLEQAIFINWDRKKKKNKLPAKLTSFWYVNCCSVQIEWNPCVWR